MSKFLLLVDNWILSVIETTIVYQLAAAISKTLETVLDIH